MKKIAVFAVAAALLAFVATPAEAFDRNTMLGTPRIAAPAAMGYVRLPFNSPNSRRLPRAGLMLSAPGMDAPGKPYVRSAFPGVVDFGVTRRSVRSRWTPTLNIGDHVAWAANPDALPKDIPRLDLMGGSTSGLIVGAVSAAIITGVYIGATND